MFDRFVSSNLYSKAGVKFIEPMTAQEASAEEIEEAFDSPRFFFEEKLDGTRGLLHFFYCNNWEELFRASIALKTYIMRYYPILSKNVYYGFLEGTITDSILIDYLQEYLPPEFNFGVYKFMTSSSGIAYSMNPSTFPVRWKFYDTKKLYTLFFNMVCNNVFLPSEHFARCFSRRVSVKTGWLTENTDSLPHIRDIKFPRSLNGTIIDGEMFIPGREFKVVSSIMNCKWDKAIDRQEKEGKIVFNAFDILFYKGIDVRDRPLFERKELLKEVVETLNSEYVSMVPYFDYTGCEICVSNSDVKRITEKSDMFPEAYKEIVRFLSSYSDNGVEKLSRKFPVRITPKAYYEYIVATGGEGIMMKPKDGKYFSKRGKEYQKVKKFLTREAIILGFTPPTKAYTGKFPTFEEWNYWENTFTGELIDSSTHEGYRILQSMSESSSIVPVSKHYFNNWIGNIVFGVIVSQKEIESLPKGKKFTIRNMVIEGNEVKVLEIGECSGFNESVREMLSKDSHTDGSLLITSPMVGRVIEVKANEIFKDTGKLRHPRFFRFRDDKSPLSCTFKDHMTL